MGLPKPRSSELRTRLQLRGDVPTVSNLTPFPRERSPETATRNARLPAAAPRSVMAARGGGRAAPREGRRWRPLAAIGWARAAAAPRTGSPPPPSVPPPPGAENGDAVAAGFLRGPVSGRLQRARPDGAGAALAAPGGEHGRQHLPAVRRGGRAARLPVAEPCGPGSRSGRVPPPPQFGFSRLSESGLQRNAINW